MPQAARPSAPPIPSVSPDANPKSRYVRGLFSAVAPTYDLLNTILSFGLHKGWRRQGAREAALGPGGSALDVATGTGDFALELLRWVGPEGRVTGADFCAPMLHLARRKAEARASRGRSGSGRLHLLLGDALALPFPDGTFDAATIGFGLRNTADTQQCLAEMVRVVRTGGRVVVLEFATPPNLLFRAIYFLYFDHILPLIGRLVHGHRESYQYLPDSVKRFADRGQLRAMMEQAGLSEVRIRDLTLGIVALHSGTKTVG